MLSPTERQSLKALLFKMYDYGVHEQAVADFHNSSARMKVITCPARTSKSYAGWKDALPDAFTPGIELARGKREVDSVLIWIAAPNYDLAKEFDYAWEDLVSRQSAIGIDYKLATKANQPKQGHMTIVIEWGHDLTGRLVTTTVEVKSAFNAKSLQSEEVDVTIMSEAARLPQEAWTKYLATRTKRSIWPTTPDIQAAWVWELIESGADHPELDIASFQFTGRANPRYDWQRFWIEHAKAESLIDGDIVTKPADDCSAPAVRNGHDCFDEATSCKAMKWDDFAEQFGGRWVFHRGRVVPLRERDSDAGAPAHVIDYDFDWMRDAFWTVACDYGYNDPAVAGFWASGPGGLLVLRSCLYQAQLTPDDFTERTLELWKTLRERFKIHRALPHRFVGDPKKPEVEALFRRRGLPIWNVDKKAQASRAAGHQELMNYLAVDSATGLPRLFVHTDCAPIIKEWRTLRWNERVRSEGSPTAIIGRDDGYDMARYFVMSRPPEIDRVQSVDSFEAARRQILREQRRTGRQATVPTGMRPVAWSA